MNDTVIVNNNGILSTGSNARNVNHIVNSNAQDIDWKSLEKEFDFLIKEVPLDSIRDFAQKGLDSAKAKDNHGLEKCFKALGSVGLEIISKTSCTMIVELAKKFLCGAF